MMAPSVVYIQSYLEIGLLNMKEFMSSTENRIYCLN
jgi:hypothetical protein